MLDDLSLEAFLVLEALGAVFGPCFALWLWNGGYEKQGGLLVSCLLLGR